MYDYSKKDFQKRISTVKEEIVEQCSSCYGTLEVRSICIQFKYSCFFEQLKKEETENTCIHDPKIVEDSWEKCRD